MSMWVYVFLYVSDCERVRTVCILVFLWVSRNIYWPKISLFSGSDAPTMLVHKLCILDACDRGSINCRSLSWRPAREPLLTFSQVI